MENSSFFRTSELAHIYEPASGLFIAESPKVIERALDAGYEPVSILLEDRHVEGQCADIIKRCGDIPIYTAPFDVLTKLTGFALTRGMLCAMRRAELPSVESVWMPIRPPSRVAMASWKPLPRTPSIYMLLILLPKMDLIF